MALHDVMQLGRPGDGDRYRFDYKGMHRYLITQTTRKAAAFVSGHENVVGILSALREACRRHDFEVYAYCFLPDQLVMLVRGKTDSADMKEFLAAFRTSTSSFLKTQSGQDLWRKKYTERVLRKGEDSREVAARIFQLPVQGGLSATPEAYPLQGSFVFDMKNLWNKRHSSSGYPRRSPRPRFR